MLYVIQVFTKQSGETPPQSLGTLQVDYDDIIFTTADYNTWLGTLGEQHFSPENLKLLYVMHYTRKVCPEVKDRILKMDPAPGTQSNALNNNQTTGTGVPNTNTSNYVSSVSIFEYAAPAIGSDLSLMVKMKSFGA